MKMYSLTHLTPQKAPDDLSDDELTQANDIVGQFIISCFRYLDLLPSLKIQNTWNKDFRPSTENEWIRLLLLNIFDGCAMSFQGCESQVLSRADGQPATICGRLCIKYFSGSMYEGISCATPKEYSDTDVMNVLQNFLAIEVLDNDKCDKHLNMGDLKEDKTAAGEDENDEKKKRGKMGRESLEEKKYEKMPTTSEQNEDTEGEILKTALQCQKGIQCRGPVGENQKEFGKECHSATGNLQYPFNMQDKYETHELSEMKKVKIGKGSYPGYAKIIKSSEASELLKIADSLNVGPVIRSTDIENLLAHEFQFDNAIAVECEYWPGEALDWETRERKCGWPGSDLILQCRKIPCSIVSKSHTLNPNDQSEWRFSFSRQEGILFRSLPILVRMVYIISKVLLKQVFLQEESLLTSYHLKTSFLWFCERTKNEQFSINELEVIICNFLQFLVKQLEGHNIPNYFIQQSNMISHLSVEKIENIKVRIEYLKSHLLEEISSVGTTKQYPFNVASTARDLRIFPSKSMSCLQKIHCNLLFAIIGHLFSMYLPNSHLVWIYCQYIPFLVQGFCSTDGHKMPTDISPRSLEAQAHTHSGLVFKVYGNEWIKLVTLYCSLVEMKAPELKRASCLLLDSSFTVQSDHLSTLFCIADTINLIGIEMGVSGTESCCLTLKEWVLKNQTRNQVFMLTLKKILTTFGTVNISWECNHLLACLTVMVNVFELSKDGVEVGMAASLRLHHSLEDIRVISTLCDLINAVELSGVLKHLVYLTVLLLEKEENRLNSSRNTKSTDDETKKEPHLFSATQKGRNVGAKHEAKKALEAMQSIMKSGILRTFIDDFRFVLAALVFQKLTMETPQRKIVHAFLKLMKSTSLSTESSDLQEIQTDVSNLLQTDTLDFNNAFQFLVFYACKSIASSGLEFTSSVLDELVQPHFNLGVLSAAGTELTATENLDESISTLELWVNRSTGAPITQNPVLRVKIYGKLGYLYHIKAMEAREEGLKAKLMAKSAVMFGTAIKEKVSDATVLVDYVLFQWERQSYADVALYLRRVCSSNDITSISVYFKHSKQLMNNMFEIMKELEVKGQIKVSSIVFAHFIAIWCSLGIAESHTAFYDGFLGQDECHKHLEEMQRRIDILDMVHRQMGYEDSDYSDEVEVLVDTNMLLGFAANRLGVYELALNAFNKALTLDPNNITAQEKIEELSVS